MSNEIYGPLQMSKNLRKCHLKFLKFYPLLMYRSCHLSMFDMMLAGQPEGEGILCATLPCHGNYDQLTTAGSLGIS